MILSSLNNLVLLPVYNSDDQNIVLDFYIPCLKVSKKYDRTSGYFNASTMFYLTAGLSSFIQNEGKIRFIIGKEISEEDFAQIQLGYELKYVEDDLIKQFDDWCIPIESIDLFWGRISNLSYLIQKGIVDIKVAFRRKGIFHEKNGIFIDSKNNKISFQGSCNETIYGMMSDYNYESFDVNRSWIESDLIKIEKHIQLFEKLWQNQSLNTIVLDFPEILKEKLREICVTKKTITVDEEISLWNCLLQKKNSSLVNEEIDFNNTDDNLDNNTPIIPAFFNGNKYELKPHQVKAIEAWKDNSFQGIFELCTGAGKTVTAIHAAVRLFQHIGQKMLIIIAVPYINLAEQWCENLKQYNINPIKCYGGVNYWQSKLVNNYHLLLNNIINLISIVVVNKTLRTKEFQESLNGFIRDDIEILMIGDEVHNHETDNNFKNLPHAKYKIGLSATISGCHKILEYYGKTLIQYSISDAIEDEILTPYIYNPILVELSDEEIVEYISLTKKIQIQEAIKLNSKEYDETLLNSLYGKRNNLLGNASNKISKVRDVLKDFKPGQSQFLIYCSSTISTDDSDISSEEREQINQATKLLNELNWKSSRYTSKESISARKNILESFKNRNLDALVAIRCLDEGVDIPAVDSAFILASTTNSKQFIQRRGRVLRRYEGKIVSNIYDLIIHIPYSDDNERNNYGKILLENEFKRVYSFAKDSLNHLEIIDQLKNLLITYDIKFNFLTKKYE